MNTEHIKAKVRTILSLPSGSAGRGVIGRDTAQALLQVIEALEAERDSALKQFRAERGRADLAVAQCEDLKESINGPIKELDKLKLRIESLAGRVDVVEATAPTQFAYDAACKALHLHRARADAAEDEIARRDAVGLEPFAYAYRYAGCETSDGFQNWREELSRERPADWMIETGKVTDLQALHTAAQPAVLPPEWDGTEHNEYAAGKQAGWNDCLEEALKLGAQPKKPVTIPGRYDIAEMSRNPFESYRCIEQDDDGEYIRRDEMLSALDDAGVPHTGGQ